jgi:hypothetical protein
MKYLFLFCGTVEQMREYETLRDEELAARLGAVRGWFETYGDRVTMSGRLQLPDAATTVRHGTGDAPLVTDGPFMEGHEVIGGLCVADVPELDDALAMARDWPGGGTIEVRPFMAAQ